MEVRSVLWLSAVARFGERIPNSLDGQWRSGERII